MKEIFPGLIKNDKLKCALSGQLSHAYIIEGKLGSGRMTAVRNCAAAVLCQNSDDPELPLPCGKCSACSRIFRGIHPDVIEFSTEGKKSIGVDTAREIRSQVFIAPVESEYKFFVIRDADLMTPEAQNALLISIEEPPPFSIFFLTVTNKSLLLETIRSRCTALTTERLDDGTITDYLLTLPEAEGLSRDSERLASFVKSADGSLGEAMGLLAGDSAQSREEYCLARSLVDTVFTGTQGDKVRFAIAFPKTRDAQEKIFTHAVSAVRDIISAKVKAGAHLMFYEDVSEITKFSAIPLRKLMAFYTALENSRIALSGNYSPSLTAESIIMIKL